ncbi:MAG: hypothetical protein V4733_07650 [Verrucomicrobiota bacterium]
MRNTLKSARPKSGRKRAAPAALSLTPAEAETLRAAVERIIGGTSRAAARKSAPRA